MPRAKVRDLNLYFELHGSGPPLLNISGSGGDLRLTAPDQNPLNAAFCVAHYDQRGLGQTSTPPLPWTMADYADDAAALLDFLGWERVPVVGTSFGGMVGMNLAVRHPGRISKLVLNCTSPGGPEYSSWPLHTLADLDPAERAETTLEIMDTRYERGGPLPPGIETFVTAIRPDGPALPQETPGAVGQLEARRGHDVVDRLGEIDVPTLVCAGAHDGIAPLRNSELLCDRIPNARLEVFDGGHVFMIQDPAAYPAMLEFLAEE
ncbi:alpha/beta fold hydrolase [Candidatus Poriferisocius sp.]|uniref:alpha/beta fold hydrolase n=1 Tax=Candidatus Poriferisocius sp. TaxID=3101276 RepID=UPI003B5A6145